MAEAISLDRDNPHKKHNKDADARWTKKRGETCYGYKQHAKVDKRNRIILSYATTPASVTIPKGLGIHWMRETEQGLES